MAKMEYRFVRAELWGNAKDGFDTNNWFTVKTLTAYKPYSERWLLKVARDVFTGFMFAWSENTRRPMCRKGITIEWSGEHDYNVMYRGHYVGEIQCSTKLRDSFKVQSIQTLPEHV